MMYHNQQFNTAQLPVPHDSIDQSTLNPNLPNGNDRIPQVQLSQWMNANQQIGLLAIGLFRSMAQSSINKSGTHCAGYNLLAQNHFNNQVWTQWAQTVIDFVEFLCLVKRYQPQEAVQKGAQRVFEAFLGMVYHSYPQLQQVTPNGMWGGLQTAMQIHQSIQADLQRYKTGQYNQPQGYNVGGGAQLPPINHGGYNVAPVNNGIASFQTSGYQPSNAPTGGYHVPATGGNSNSVDSAFYDDPVPTKPLMPVEEISSDNTDYFGNPIPSQEQPKMQSFNQAPQQSFAQPEETNLPVPSNVNEVVVDPTYYAPQGVKFDLKRPYDTVYNPGGIVIRPAHQVPEWEVTIGDDMPWHQLVDPRRFCTFLVKFPDGVIKEIFVEWNPSMEYLRHEMDAEMRRKAYRPEGIVVASATPISTIGGDAAKESEVFSLVKDGHLKRQSCPPVVLENTFTGATNLEVEASVREELQNLLEIQFDKDVPMPAVEYRSTFLNPLPITEECYDQLTMLSKQEELGQVALGLRELVTQGILPTRYFHFINDRFTRAVNDVLADGLTLTSIDITDFCEDYVALEDYLTEKKGDTYVKKLRDAASAIINKAMLLMDGYNGDEEDATREFHVADNYINFQLGWTLDDLAPLNIRSGKAVLISASAHPVILEALKGMIGRANSNPEFVAGALRLITADGYYLEVVKGRLVEKATLLKLVK